MILIPYDRRVLSKTERLDQRLSFIKAVALVTILVTRLLYYRKPLQYLLTWRRGRDSNPR